MENTLIDIGFWNPDIGGKFWATGLDDLKTEVAKSYHFIKWSGFWYEGGVRYSSSNIGDDIKEWHQDGKTIYTSNGIRFPGLDDYDFWLIFWTNKNPTELRDLERNKISLKSKHIYAIRNIFYQHRLPVVINPESMRDRWFIRWWAERTTDDS